MSLTFSLVTVCRNSASVLPGALASLNAQTYPEREWVVVDGASTDGTLDIVRASAESLGDWISEPDTGIYNAMNKGWRRARGDIVYFLNSDDALLDDHVLATVAEAFARDPRIDMVVGEVVYRFGDGTLIRRNYRHIDARTLLVEDLCHQAVFARRRLFDRIGGFNETFQLNADYDWLIRAFRSGARIDWLQQPVAYFSTGGAHTRDPALHEAERRAVRLQYVSRVALAFGLLKSRVVHRLHRMIRHRRLGHFVAVPR